MKRAFLAALIGFGIGFVGYMGLAKAESVNPTLDGVIECDSGRMHYDNSGWLIGAESRVDYHKIVSITPTNAMSDAMWHKMLDGANIVVCQSDGRLHYSVQHSIIVAANR